VAHRAAIGAAGLHRHELRREGLALDLDEPEDIAALLAQTRPGNSAAEFLTGGELGARVRVALDSLPDAAAAATGARP
jgi:hypothetical protein